MLRKFINRTLAISTLLIATTTANALETNLIEQIKTESPSIKSIRSTYKTKDFHKTISQAKLYLSMHPKDVDAKLYMGLSYYQLKDYKSAEHYFDSILVDYPNYKEARIGLIRSLLAQKKYKQARTVSNDGLALNKDDTEFKEMNLKIDYLLNSQKISKKKKAPIKRKASIKKYKKASLSKFSKKVPEKHLRDKPHYEIGGFADNLAVNKPDQIWNISSIYLYRKNEYGAFGINLNPTNRNQQKAVQLYLNAIPKLTNNVWLDLGYGYANNPNLFPNQLGFGEIYIKTTKTLIVSGGGSYKKIDKTNLNMFTASIANYFGQYFISLRPIHFMPNSGPKSTLYKLKLRKYADNPDSYIGIILASGTAPDLYDLLTVNFIKTRSNIGLLEGQQAISDSIMFQYGGGYETQLFPNQLLRRFVHLDIGIKIRVA
jgi:YaiO family outer membrane protein